MAYPDPPERLFDYSAFEQSQGNGNFPGQELDVDLDGLIRNLTELNTFLRGITRSDGRLANLSVGREQLAADISLGFTTPTVWAPNTYYAVLDTVTYSPNGAIYRCIIAHTSDEDFDVDLASGRWEVLFQIPASTITEPDAFVGDGTTTDFTLSLSPATKNAVFITIDGIAQHKATFSVSGNQVVFSEAPPLGCDIEIAVIAPSSVETVSADGLQTSIDIRQVGFDTRADLIAATVPAPVMRVWAGGLPYIRDAAGTAATSNSGAVAWAPDGDIYPDHFAENTTPGTTDMTAAILAAVSWLNTKAATGQARLVFRAARYKITDSIDFTLAAGAYRREVVGGGGGWITEIIVGYHGYGTDRKSGAAFQFGDESSPAFQSPFNLKGFYFSRASSGFRLPVAVSLIAPAQCNVADIVVGAWSNTNFRIWNSQNCHYENLMTFSGGYAWPYKDTSGVTVTQSGTTLTSSAPLFSASDEGHFARAWGTGASTYRRALDITSYGTETTVTVSKSVTDATARNLWFGAPHATMTSGGDVLTSDAPCFTAEHIGLSPWVREAGANGRFLRATIEAVPNSNTAELDGTAGASVTSSEFCVPAVEIYSHPSLSNGSYNTFAKCMFENHSGVGIAMAGQTLLHFTSCKIHGEQTPAAGRYSVACIWGEQVGGAYEGDLSAQYIGEERVFITYLTSPFKFPGTHTRTAIDEVLVRVGLQASGYEGALVYVDSWSVIGAGSDADMPSLIRDDNSGNAGYALQGTHTFNQLDQTRSFLGNSVSATPAGDLTVETLRIASPNPPASASATGTAGQIEWDGSYIYVCTATDTWVRAALSTW